MLLLITMKSVPGQYINYIKSVRCNKQNIICCYCKQQAHYGVKRQVGFFDAVSILFLFLCRTMSPAHPLAHKQACTYVFTCISGIFSAYVLYVGSLESEWKWNTRVQRRAAVLRNVCVRDRKEELMWWWWMWVSAMLTEPAQWAWETVSFLWPYLNHTHTRAHRQKHMPAHCFKHM